ncbi:right-handed parallel beta-helix repeat-containing protein, partial [Methanococcoides sp. SA1]|nr:right-handed parallel beta-helix repeat-containing protein [Methanococcoides sp. SA1]
GYSSNNTLTSNTANNNTNKGIYFSSSCDYNVLTNNTVSFNEYGTYFSESSNNILINNVMSSNAYNFGVIGDSLDKFMQDIDSSNTVDGKPIYYWISRSDEEVPSDAGSVYVINSTNITVKDIEVTNEIYGVLFAYTDNSTIQNLTNSENSDGVRLISSSSNTLDDINASSNDNNGFYLSSSINSTLRNNTANYNVDDGFYLSFSSNSILSNNTANCNVDDGFYLSSSGNSIFSNNTANCNVDNGFHLLYSSNSIFSNNTANSNVDDGFYLSYSSNSIFSNNTANSNVDDGFYLSYSSNSIFSNNTANSNNDYGFYLYGTGNSDLINNTAIGNIDHDLYSNRENIVENIVVTHNSSTISFITDRNRIQVSGEDTHSTVLAGRTNVNGYVDISSSGSAIQNVTFLYDDSEMTDVEEASLALFRLNGSQWVEVPDSSLNSSGNHVSANLTEFGTFGLFKEYTATSPTISSSSSGGSVASRVRSQGTITDLPVNGDGKLTFDAVVKSSDTKTTLTLREGTVAVDPAGNPVNKIIVTKPASLPADTPADVVNSGLYYDFGPSGTTFSKDIMISIYFDSGEFEGRAPTIYTHTSEDGWIALETTIDWENGRVTAMTNHFSMYALFGTDSTLEEDGVETSVVGSAPVTEEGKPVENDDGFGSLYWITGIGIVLMLGIVVMRKPKNGEGL